MFDFITQEKELGAAPLTVLAQAVDPNDNGQLLWDIFFPRSNVPSVKLANIHNIDWRPVADRREWNDTGRLIHQPTPAADTLEMTPIEAYFRLAEREIQDIQERVAGNQAIFRELIKADIPARTAQLAQAVYRRLELDVFTAWALGTVVARDSKTNATNTFSFGYDAARYAVAGVAWTGGAAGTAFENLVAWLADVEGLVGAYEGVMLRQATLNAIVQSAPQGVNAVQRSISETEQLIQDRTGSEFRFFKNERTASPYTTAGLTTTVTKIWTEHIIAAVPSGRRVGSSAFAPVYRAGEAAGANAEGGIDLNGLSVFRTVSNSGRELKVECQGNILPIPEERLVATIHCGI